MASKYCEECGAPVWLNVVLDAWCEWNDRVRPHVCPGLDEPVTGFPVYAPPTDRDT